MDLTDLKELRSRPSAESTKAAADFAAKSREAVASSARSKDAAADFAAKSREAAASSARSKDAAADFAAMSREAAASSAESKRFAAYFAPKSSEAASQLSTAAYFFDKSKKAVDSAARSDAAAAYFAAKSDEAAADSAVSDMAVADFAAKSDEAAASSRYREVKDKRVPSSIGVYQFLEHLKSVVGEKRGEVEKGKALESMEAAGSAEKLKSEKENVDAQKETLVDDFEEDAEEQKTYEKVMVEKVNALELKDAERESSKLEKGSKRIRVFSRKAREWVYLELASDATDDPVVSDDSDDSYMYCSDESDDVDDCEVDINDDSSFVLKTPHPSGELKLHPRSLLTPKHYDSDALLRAKPNDWGCVHDVNPNSPSLCFNWEAPGLATYIPECCDSKLDRIWKPSYIILVDTMDTFARVQFAGLDDYILLFCSFDVATCRFLKLLKREIPGVKIVALVNSDPSSLKLLSFYENYRGKGLSDDLAAVSLDIKWLGFRRLDRKYDVAAVPAVPMSQSEVDAASQLLDDPFVAGNTRREAEVHEMIDREIITEVLFLNSVGYGYLADTYLSRKLLESDWI